MQWTDDERVQRVIWMYLLKPHDAVWCSLIQGRSIQSINLHGLKHNDLRPSRLRVVGCSFAFYTAMLKDIIDKHHHYTRRQTTRKNDNDKMLPTLCD